VSDIQTTFIDEAGIDELLASASAKDSMAVDAVIDKALEGKGVI